jgi:hypothetical protein
MFDFDVVTGPSDLAKRERRSPAPTAAEAPPSGKPLSSGSAAAPVSAIVAEDGAGYPEARPA